MASSRWLIMLLSFRWRYSMGSSMVMIWASRVRFTASTTQARVVDLPPPAGPVTRTMPRVMLAIFMISSGMSISFQLGMPKLTIRITADREPLCR